MNNEGDPNYEEARSDAYSLALFYFLMGAGVIVWSIKSGEAKGLFVATCPLFFMIFMLAVGLTFTMENIKKKRKRQKNRQFRAHRAN